jgi:ATP-dependent exoDNAse (exonuclease V) alpha subunit
MNDLSKSARDNTRLQELLAKAKMHLQKQNLLPPTPELPNTIEEKPTILEPVRNPQLDVDAAVKLKQKQFREEQAKLLAEKQEQLNKEIVEIRKNRPKLELNDKQQEFIDKGKSGESIVLIGQAGTGKTSVVREFIQQVREDGKIGPIIRSTKYLQSGLPGVVVVSFTNRAVKNLAKGMPADMKQHCLTVHKLLEFRPVKITVQMANGDLKETMRFLPNRNSSNPLPAELKLVIFEESSMISTELHQQLIDAIPHECQFIYLGDLQQLPPVYGQAILGFKLLELPVIELTKIYRQAEGSPIIEVAHRIARGDGIKASEFPEINKASRGKILIKPWKKRLDDFGALHIMTLFFRDAIDGAYFVQEDGKRVRKIDPKLATYDPNEDMIMLPFNKKFGTIELNKEIAQYLGRKRDATVFEIISGFAKYYMAVGDKILVDRQEGIIEAINFNADYKGSAPQPADKKLNRWGIVEKEANTDPNATHATSEEEMEELENFMLRQVARDPDDEEAKRQASHILVCRLLDSDEIVEVRTTGEYSSLVFAYALTIHKCQGSEWRRCFLLLHNSHATMLSRELLYTAVTRAREELVIICEPEALVKGVATQRIKGNTIAEKAEYFKGKLEREL